MPVPHIAVCICTFKRAELLKTVLTHMENQHTGAQFTYSVVVADNDAAQSGRAVVEEFCRTSSLPVVYCNEPQQNIALARNKAVENARGEYIAFIDDDEFPAEDWLLRLFEACATYGAAGVLGPVKPYFPVVPPEWIVKGRFFEKTSHATGHRLSWNETRTSNVLFKTSILTGVDPVFQPQFAMAGEDMDFFRRMIDKGDVFVWSNDGLVYEAVPPARANLRFLVRRALLRGSGFPAHPKDRLRNIVKSLVAVPCYTLALPVLAILGRHMLISYLVKLCDHAARLLAFLGFPVMVERQT